MKIEDIKIGDVLTYILDEGHGFIHAHAFKVIRINKVTVRVVDKWGRKARATPDRFEGKTDMTLEEFYQ